MGIPSVPDVIGQLINGHVFDFSSIEFEVGANSFTTIQSISYTDSLESGKLRGSSSKVLGRTRGEYNAEGSFDLYKGDLQTLLALLAALGQGGYMEASFKISVNYNEPGQPVQTDTLIGCRIGELADDHAVGSDALITSVTLDVMELSRGGLSATSGGASGAGVGSAVGGLIGGGL